jgi:hypothetical protein
MALSDLWADNLVNLFLATPGAPAGLPDMHLQLYLVLPAPDGTGGVVPAGADGYAGPVDVSGGGFWPDSTGGAGESLLAADVSFGTPSADWGPIVGCAFTDAAGVLVTLGEEFDTPYDVTVGVPFVLPASAVSFAAATAG